MKKSLLPLVFITIIAFVMNACNGVGGGNDPKSVTKKFFEALKTMDVEEASKYATKESKGMLDLVKMGMSMAKINKDSLHAEMDKHPIIYGDPVINGDEATVSVSENGTEKTDIKLKKEDGEWKVAFDKNTLFKTGMEKMEEHGDSDMDMQEAQEALKNLDSDSMKKMMEEATRALDSLHQ